MDISRSPTWRNVGAQGWRNSLVVAVAGYAHGACAANDDVGAQGWAGAVGAVGGGGGADEHVGAAVAGRRWLLAFICFFLFFFGSL